MTAQEAGGLWQGPLAERRMRAKEAFLDARALGGTTGQALNQAINTAVHVHITKDVHEAASQAYERYDSHPFAIAEAIQAAFEAAGFEVQS